MRLLRTFFFVLLSAAALATSSSDEGRQASSTLPELTICDLAHQSKLYDGKTVRVRGTTVDTFEEIQLVEPACATMRSALSFAHLNKNNDQVTFDHMMEKCQAADIVVRGTFHGSDRLLMSQDGLDLVQRHKTGYGYLRSSPMLIEVFAVEKVSAASLPGFKQCSAL